MCPKIQKKKIVTMIDVCMKDSRVSTLGHTILFLVYFWQKKETMADVESDATTLPADVLLGQNSRAAKNQKLFEEALFESKTHETVRTQASSMMEEDNVYAYKHPADSPRVVAAAIIREQSAIGDWISAFKPLLKLQNATNVVVQTLRCTDEEGQQIMEEQKACKLSVRLPPQAQPCQKMTMTERLQTKSSQIGYLRVTFDAQSIAANNLSADTLIPCMFSDPVFPVVGLGPAVTVSGVDFLWHLENMLQCMARNNAKEGHIILDNVQMIFGFTYQSVSTNSFTMMESTGVYSSAPSIKNRQVSYLTYAGTSLSEGISRLSNHNPFIVETIDALDDSYLKWYETDWEKDNIKKCLSVLGLPASQNKAASSTEGDSIDGVTSCKIDIKHAFVPPAKYRTGWEIGNVLSELDHSSFEKSNWWGFVESIHLSVSMLGDHDVFSENTLYTMIGPDNDIAFQQMPYVALQDYAKIIAKSMVGGLEEASKVLEKCMQECWPSAIDPVASSLEASEVPSVRINLKRLQVLLNAATAANCQLVSKHSTKRYSQESGGIIMLYRYGNEMPGAKSNKTSREGGQRERPQAPPSVSSYLVRPVTMSIMVTANLVEPETNQGNRLDHLDPSKYAPNGVEWRQLLPDIQWAFECDYMTVNTDSRRAAIDSTMQDMMDQDYLDFATMDD